MTSDQLNNINETEKLLSILSSEELCLFLIDKGFEVDPKKDPQLLIKKCKSNALKLVKKLIEKGYDPNAEGELWDGKKLFTSPIREAISGKASDVAQYLLQQNVEIKSDTLLLAVSSDNKIDVIKEIVARRPDIISQTNFNGDSLLSLAAAEGNKEVFDFLIESGLNPLAYSHDGNNAYYQALYHDKDKNLEIPEEQFPFDLGVFGELAKYLRNHSETKSMPAEDVAKYAAKFACLFDDVNQLESYIENHKGESRQILHDLTLFEFPQEQIRNREAWSNLAIEHGPQLTKYLFLANAIESSLGRSPVDFAEVKKEAAKIKYPRALENLKMAEIFSKNIIPERAFNKILDSYSEKTEDHIPDIFIEGSEFGQDRFYMKKLAKDDLRGFVLGNITNCCQYVGGAGNDCAEHGMKSPYGAFYVVFKREKDGRINNLKSWIENLDNASNEQEFLQKLPDKSSRAKYREIISDIKEDLQYHNSNAPEFSEIKQVLKESFLRKLEGEVIAQSWVWISKDNALVLDSWERLRDEDDKLLKPFLEIIAKNVLINNPEIKKITIGSGGYTPRYFALGKVSNPEVPIDYDGYRDSEEQFLVAKRVKENGIKFNEALFIKDERIAKLDNRVGYGEELTQVVEIQKTWRERLEAKKESQEEKSGMVK